MCERLQRSGRIFSLTWWKEPWIHVILTDLSCACPCSQNGRSAQTLTIIQNKAKIHKSRKLRLSVRKDYFFHIQEMNRTEVHAFIMDSSGWLMSWKDLKRIFKWKPTSRMPEVRTFTTKWCRGVKKRHKIGYLRHQPTHTHLRLLWFTQGHTRWRWHAWFDRWYQPIVSDTALRHALFEQRRLLPGQLLLWSSGGQPVEEGELPGMLAEPGPWNKTTIQVGSDLKCELCRCIIQFGIETRREAESSDQQTSQLCFYWKQ